MDFEWDDAKAEANWRDYGVSFELAKSLFRDPFAVERIDDREDYGEVRFVIVAMRRANTYFVWPTRKGKNGFASFRREG